MVFIILIIAFIDSSEIYSAIKNNKALISSFNNNSFISAENEVLTLDSLGIISNEPLLEIELWMTDQNYLIKSIQKDKKMKSIKRSRNYRIDDGVQFEKIG